MTEIVERVAAAILKALTEADDNDGYAQAYTLDSVTLDGTWNLLPVAQAAIEAYKAGKPQAYIMGEDGRISPFPDPSARIAELEAALRPNGARSDAPAPYSTLTGL